MSALFEIDPNWIIDALRAQGSLTILSCMLVFSFSLPLLLIKALRKEGVYIFTVISVIVANIQVLKSTIFPFYPSPMALGSVVFGANFLCNDLLTEVYGASFARRNILVGFLSMAILPCLMLLTISYPIVPETAGNANAMSLLFTPMPLLLLSSLVAYGTSSLINVALFSYLQKKISGALWLRNNLSSIVAIGVDNSIFSLCAFYLFTPNPLPLNEVFMTYILGTYLLRVLISMLDTPFVYLGKWLLQDRIQKDRLPS